MEREGRRGMRKKEITARGGKESRTERQDEERYLCFEILELDNLWTLKRVAILGRGNELRDRNLFEQEVHRQSDLLNESLRIKLHKETRRVERARRLEEGLEFLVIVE
jgi:hypothetical protein